MCTSSFNTGQHLMQLWQKLRR